MILSSVNLGYVCWIRTQDNAVGLSGFCGPSAGEFRPDGQPDDQKHRRGHRKVD
jgi:hypothetical protein